MSIGRAFRRNPRFCVAAMTVVQGLWGCNAPQQAAPAGAATWRDAGDIYLSPSETGGGRLCFNPESQRLRALLRTRPRAGDPVDPIALYEDLPFLRDVMRLQYAGYAQIVQRSDFDLSSFFDHWKKDLAGAG